MVAKLLLSAFLLGSLLGAGCSTVGSRIERHREGFSSWPAVVRQKVAAGEIELGFSAEQVRVALGEPHRISTQATPDGPAEVWSYRRRGPRIAIGVGLGVGAITGSSVYSGGIGVGTGLRDDERLAVVFDRAGRVVGLTKR